MPQLEFRLLLFASVLTAAGCVTAPPTDTQVVLMKPGELPADPGLPPAGTTWRLDEQALMSLSPAPYVAPPPTPVPPLARAVPVVPAVPYPLPYSYYDWAAPYYGPFFGFSFGYVHPRHPYRRWRR